MRQFGKYAEFIEELTSKLNNDETVFLVGNIDRVMMKLGESGFGDQIRSKKVYKTTPFSMSFDELYGTYYFSGGDKVLSGYKIFKVN